MPTMRHTACRIDRVKIKSKPTCDTYGAASALQSSGASNVVERKFRISVDGKKYEVTVEETTQGGSRILPQPGDMQIPESKAAPVAAAPAAAALEAAGPDDLASPLAGVLESLAVSKGSNVSQGDPVAVIEAMKMKTTVVAHRDGEVVEIAVKVGDAVDAGQPLMTIQ